MQSRCVACKRVLAPVKAWLVSRSASVCDLAGGRETDGQVLRLDMLSDEVTEYVNDRFGLNFNYHDQMHSVGLVVVLAAEARRRAASCRPNYKIPYRVGWDNRRRLNWA